MAMSQSSVQTAGAAVLLRPSFVRPSDSEDDQLEAELIDKIRLSAAGFRTEGAPFPPFLFKMGPPPRECGVGAAPTFGPPTMRIMTFYAAKRDGAFRSFGDTYAWVKDGVPKTSLLAAPAPGKEQALAQPTGFRNLANVPGMAYWSMIPPENYVPLGIVVTTRWEEHPLAENYWCVHKDHVKPTDAQNLWDLFRDCGLRVPTMPLVQVEDREMLLVPPIMLPEAKFQHPTNVLRVHKSYLDLPTRREQLPNAETDAVSGQTLAEGLTRVNILPGFAVPGVDPLEDPVCFLGMTRWWCCIRSDNIAGQRSYQFTVGTE